MNRVKKIVCSLAIVVSPWIEAKSNLLYLDFNSSMKRSEFEHLVVREKTEQLVGITGIDLMDFFEQLYKRTNFLELQLSEFVRIPKIIHQIWIGDGVPEELRAFQESWKRYHPDWEYHLWTQHDIAALNLYNADLLAQAQNPAEQSDIIRYELLYRFGGVYIDMDQECLQPFDELHYLYDFYIGVQPLDSGIVQLGIGVIGSIPGHPLLKACIESIANNYKNEKIKNTLTAKTGPIHMTRIFMMMAGVSGTRDVALPAHYFYPLGAMEAKLIPDIWRSRGSLAVHHWAKTWNKPQYRRPQFRNIKSWGELI